MKGRDWKMAWVLAAVTAAGCGGSSPEVEAERSQDETGGEAMDRRAPMIAASQQPTDPAGTGRCEVGTVYFEYDSDTLDARSRDILDSAARCMLRGGSAEVQLTGATDPRGTEEYNLALGDRRASAVKDYLRRLGVDERSLTTRSVGEEWAQGRDEAGWSRDRRVTAEVR